MGTVRNARRITDTGTVAGITVTDTRRAANGAAAGTNASGVRNKTSLNQITANQKPARVHHTGRFIFDMQMDAVLITAWKSFHFPPASCG